MTNGQSLDRLASSPHLNPFHSSIHASLPVLLPSLPTYLLNEFISSPTLSPCSSDFEAGLDRTDNGGTFIVLCGCGRPAGRMALPSFVSLAHGLERRRTKHSSLSHSLSIPPLLTHSLSISRPNLLYFCSPNSNLCSQSLDFGRRSRGRRRLKFIKRTTTTTTNRVAYLVC